MKAVLIIDMLKGFVDEKTNNGPCAMYLPGARELVPKINKLITGFIDKVLIISVGDSHYPGNEELTRFPMHCLSNTEESCIVDGVVTNTTYHSITKQTFSGFCDTSLNDLLQYYKINELIVVGVCTDICVLHTVAAAKFSGYDVTVVADCCMGLTSEGHDWAIKHMEHVLGAKIQG